MRKSDLWVALFLGMVIEIALIFASGSEMPYQPWLHPATSILVFALHHGWTSVNEPSFVLLFVSAGLVDAICYAVVLYGLMRIARGRRLHWAT
jgi:hypothetical protein